MCEMWSGENLELLTRSEVMVALKEFRSQSKGLCTAWVPAGRQVEAWICTADDCTSVQPQLHKATPVACSASFTLIFIVLAI